jgi:LPXTG-motif cell wall-anchored protein
VYLGDDDVEDNVALAAVLLALAVLVGWLVRRRR